MTTQAWRIDPIGRSLAWVYVRPHEVEWAVPLAALNERGYSVTEERQNLVDDGLGACLRYLAVKLEGRSS